MTAVTSKFYRSQSDTVKSITPVTSRTLSKPGSLGIVCYSCIFFYFTMSSLIMSVSSKAARKFGSAGSVFCKFVCIFPYSLLLLWPVG